MKHLISFNYKCKHFIAELVEEITNEHYFVN